MKNVIVVVMAALLWLGKAYAEPAVWYVHPDSFLNSIQAALDSCADSDIVLVGPGTYFENIIWPYTQGIHLVSETGLEHTIIDGGEVGCVITCSTGLDTTSIIRGFTIRNGWLSGVTCSNNSSPTIIDNRICDNRAICGGDIHCINSSPTIIGNTIAGNTIGSMDRAYGGGIYCKNSSSIIIDNSIAYNYVSAQWAYGGGIGIDDSCSLVIIGNDISHNTAAGYSASGGGIFCNSENTSATIENCTASYNEPSGISCSGFGTIIGNTLTGNIGHGILCGDFFGGESLYIIGNTISGNTADGIHVWMSDLIISKNGITYNATNGGCGICFEGGSAFIDSCTVSYNLGNGVSVYSDVDGPIQIVHCDVAGNTGFGVYNESPDVISAENNWWGDATGPFHPDSNPGGLGDSVSDCVDFRPWLTEPVGVKEKEIIEVEHRASSATIFSGLLRLPEGKRCRVFDITGRVVAPDKIRPGVYFIEIDGQIAQKVVKVR